MSIEQNRIGEGLQEAVYHIPFAMENILRHQAEDWDAAKVDQGALVSKLFEEIAACVGVMNLLGYVVGVDEETGGMTYVRKQGANVIPYDRLQAKRRDKI